VGGTRVLQIPASLAYGSRGAGCRSGECAIPPDASLTFTVELKSIGK
jgi:peptidylprolyl isomerase